MLVNGLVGTTSLQNAYGDSGMLIRDVGRSGEDFWEFVSARARISF